MKINKIKINQYGKLNNKIINLEKFNLIYGKNESGKSTLLNFIIDMFFGISKNKEGKKISDFDKYYPWSENIFSGNLEYELDNKNKFSIFRNFLKKNPEVYDENNNEISAQFGIHKKEGNQFFINQTGVDKSMLKSTVVSLQNGTKIDSNSQNQLLQRIANLTESGEEETSYREALRKLEKTQLTEIGTERSQERPLNITKKNIKTYESKIEEIKEYKSHNLEYEKIKNQIQKNLEEEKNNKIIYEKINNLLNKNNLENEKIKIKNKIVEENNKKIQKKYQEKNVLEKNKNKKLNLFILLFLIIINLIGIIFIKNKIIKLIMLLLIPIFLIYIIIKNKKNNSKLIDEQINILEKNNLELKNEVENMQKELIKENQSEKNKLINLYGNNISDLFISEINEIIKDNNEMINDLELQLYKLELNKKNIEQKLEKLAEYEEKLEIEEEKLKELNEKSFIFETTKELMNTAYEKMKNSVTPKFAENLSRNIEKFSNGKYKKVIVNDEILVELDNGQRISIEKLSTGTIEQIYLALRLSVIDEISNETLPIILDETFAYYDDERLKETLLLLNEIPNQVIILTCTNREKIMLDEIIKNYNYIEL